MASGPYQSNLFRFVIGQYRQGLDRHRRAVRGARSTVTLGAALPVYAVVSICQLAGRKLRQYRLHSRLFGSQVGAANLLDFSDFDEHRVPQEMGKKALVVDCNTRVAAERRMAQMLMMVGACLDPLQIKILSAARSATNDPAAGRITGIASDWETRSLVLVKGHTLVWNGLSGTQQAELQAQIGQCALVRPARSFWVEVLRVLMWLQRRCQPKSTALPSRLSGLPTASPKLSTLPLAATEHRKRIRPEPKMSDRVIAVGGNPLQVLAGHSTLNLAAEKEGGGNRSLYLDADAVVTGYVEHPLEKLLKWVDRLLLWVENQYRAVKLWLSRYKSRLG